jgi:thioredoxin-like negative regulator of GroEL
MSTARNEDSLLLNEWLEAYQRNYNDTQQFDQEESANDNARQYPKLLTALEAPEDMPPDAFNVLWDILVNNNSEDREKWKEILADHKKNNEETNRNRIKKLASFLYHAENVGEFQNGIDFLTSPAALQEMAFMLADPYSVTEQIERLWDAVMVILPTSKAEEWQTKLKELKKIGSL